MKRKYYLLALCCTIAFAVFFTSLGNALYSTDYNTGEVDVIIDTTNAIPGYDPKAAMSEDTIRALKAASPEAAVSFNGKTGEITITEPNASTSRIVQDIEPCIPDGLEVAPEPIPDRAIIGTDNRTQITNINAYPYCAVALLEITYADGATGRGSGAFVGATTILTAGHVVYSQSHGWATSVTVYPGGTGSTFGSSTTSSVASVSGWVSDANWSYDYGVVNISSSLGTGSFGTRALSNSNLRGANIYNYGFPGDKPYGTLWYCEGSVGTVYTRRFLHNADTYGGNSGGPVVKTDDYTYIIGIHSDAYNSNYNIATRVTSAVVEYVRGYIE